MIARTILYIPIDLFATIFACLFVNLWAPIFSYQPNLPAWLRWLSPITERVFTKEPGRLPGWLKCFDTFDTDLDTGVRDMGWPPGYWSRVRYLYRNPAYGFSYLVLGCKFVADDWQIIQGGYDDGTWETGTFRAESRDGYFNYFGIWHGIRIKFGWKARNQWSRAGQCWKPDPWGPEWRLPFVFSISFA